MNYYASTVRSSYLSQPAATLIESGQAHSAFPTGGPIVAVIDTGVDPTHPALVNSLVGGYDFTRDQPGIPDELSQSTVVILDQSMVILDGGSTFPSDFGHGTMVPGLIHLVAHGSHYADESVQSGRDL